MNRILLSCGLEYVSKSISDVVHYEVLYSIHHLDLTHIEQQQSPVISILQHTHTHRPTETSTGKLVLLDFDFLSLGSMETQTQMEPIPRGTPSTSTLASFLSPSGFFFISSNCLKAVFFLMQSFHNPLILAFFA